METTQQIEPDREACARAKLRKLWQTGDLFHVFSRYPRRPEAPRVDRLAGILKHGLVAPGACDDGSVCSDLSITATGLSIPYDRLVFLHRFGTRSSLYTMIDAGRIAVFVDPELPVMSQTEMGRHWPVLCQDEVYVRDRVSISQIIGIAVHPADARSVMDEHLPQLKHQGIPLYSLDSGVPLWPNSSSM